MISFVYLRLTFIFASAKKAVLINAAILILSLVQFSHSSILLFLLAMLVKRVCLIK